MGKPSQEERPPVISRADAHDRIAANEARLWGWGVQVRAEDRAWVADRINVAMESARLLDQLRMPFEAALSVRRLYRMAVLVWPDDTCTDVYRWRHDIDAKAWRYPALEAE